MGKCCYCKKMIYLDWIAERGYHRECHARHMEVILEREQSFELCESRWNRHQRKAEKRRARRAEIRRLSKAN